WKYGKAHCRDIWRSEPVLRITSAASFFLTRYQTTSRHSHLHLDRYHHPFVREDQPFEPGMVLAAVDLAITQVHAQLAEKKRQSEQREPPPSVELPLVDNNFPT
ncbi:hypothetical protein BGX30_001037, partial [Mortierella sp. GBA39]